MTHYVDHFCELMARVHDGSEDAARELVEDFGEEIRRAVRRVLHARMRSEFDSLDFVQIVWRSLFRMRDILDQFDCPEDLAVYLVSMARHKVVDEMRRRMMGKKYSVHREESLEQLQAEEDLDIPDPYGQPDPLDTAIAEEQWDRLSEAQPDRYRQILELRRSGHTYEEIAEILGMDPNAVFRMVGNVKRRISHVF